ncbi:MAG: hypothetical protein AAF696_18275, partial [Bacteroidota bacterium]
MTRFWLVLFFFCLLINSQAQEITYKAEKKAITNILNDISDQYEIFFSYSSELESSYQQSIDAKGQPIEEFLKRLLEPSGFKAKRNKGNYFYIQKVKRRVSLKIIDLESNEPLAFALVKFSNSLRASYANAKGLAELTYNSEEDSLIEVKYIGYLTHSFRIYETMPSLLTIGLQPDSVALEEVLIEYNNEAITLTEGAQFILNPGKMKVFPGLAEADVLLSLQTLPGIESNNETTSGINVRGGGSDELLIYLDRIPVYKKSHFFGVLTAFIPSTVEKITAYKNYIPTNYTGATSGLLELSLPDSVPDKFNTVLNANFTHGDIFLQIPLVDNLSLSLAGRKSYHDQFNSPTFSAQRIKLFRGSRQEQIFDDIIDGSDDDFVFKNQI